MVIKLALDLINIIVNNIFQLIQWLLEGEGAHGGVFFILDFLLLRIRFLQDLLR